MKLDEMVSLIGPFGFEPQEVRERLAAGESAFNAWEGLKLELQHRWEELDPREQVELQEAYEKLQGLTLKSAKKRSELVEEEAQRLLKLGEELDVAQDRFKAKNRALFFMKLEDVFREKLAEDPTNEKARQALEKLRRGELPF